MKATQAITRTILTLALLCGVYKETGIWTTCCLFLIFIGIEVGVYNTTKKANKQENKQ